MEVYFIYFRNQLLREIRKPIFYTRIVPLVLLLILGITYCSVRTEPDKVWNIRKKVVALAESLVGLQYRFGGEDIDGFDCSGLVSYVYDCYGYKIPRTAKRQSKLKKKIKLRRAKPGDIVIFKIKRNRWHTGLYIGDNEFIHAPNRKAKVRKERLNKYWRKRLKHAVSMLPMH